MPELRSPRLVRRKEKPSLCGWCSSQKSRIETARKEIDIASKNLERELMSASKNLERELMNASKNLERDLDKKIQKALDNPLSKN